MKKRKQLGIFHILVAFFSGVLATLFFLVPGKTGPTLLVNGNRQVQFEDLSRAANKVELLSNKVLSLAYQTKDFLAEKLDDEKEE